MGLQKIGLGGVLSFATAAAEQSMGRMSRKFGFLRGAASQTRAQLAQMGASLQETGARFVSSNKAASGLSTRLASLRGGLASLGATAKAVGQETQRGIGRIVGGGGLGQATTEIKRMGGVYRDAAIKARETTRQFGFFRRATDGVTDGLGRTSSAYRDASGRMRQANGQFLTGGKSAEMYSGRLGKLRGSFSSLGSTSGMSMTQMAAGALMLGSVMAGLGRKVGDIVSKYNDFNKQMSVVRSVAGDISDNQFQALRDQAIALGSATSFTATEAAEGLENLARAGFSVEEAIGASRATLDLAAADSMGLAEAAGITANIIRAMGLSAEKDSQRVADVLAMTSASTNTNVSELGEAFKMASSSFALFGIEVEEGSAILGKLADAGLKGTMGGTSFNNMMNKLVRPTKTAAKFMKDMNIEITDSDGKMRKVTSIIQDVGNALGTIPDKGDRVAMAMELTGLRGVKAVNGLMQALKDDGLTELEKNLLAADGAAKRMADERLNNMSGQLIILESATEGFTIRLFDMFKGMNGSMIKPIVDAMVRLNEAWDAVKSALDEGMFEEKRAELDRKHGSTMIAIVVGIRDGVKTLQDTIAAIGKAFDRLAERTEGAFGPNVVQKIVQVGVVIAGIAAVIGVVVGSLGMLIIAIGAVMILAQTVGMGIMTAFVPLVLIAGILGAAFLFIRNEGESLGDVLIRVWGGVRDAALDLWYNGIVPLWEALSSGFLSEWGNTWFSIQVAIADTKESIRQFGLAISDLWNRMTEGAGSIDFTQIGALASEWIGKIITGLLKVAALLFDVATVIIGAVIPVMEVIRSLIMGLWSNVLQPFLAGLLAGWNAVWPTLRLVAMEVFDAIGLLVQQLIDSWNELTAGVTGSSVDWQGWATFAVEAIGWVLIAAMKIIKWAITAVRVVIDIITNVVQAVAGILMMLWNVYIKRPIEMVRQLFSGLIDAFMQLVSGDVLGAFKTASLAILNFLLSPIRLVVGAVADLVTTLLNLSAVKKLLPESQLKSMNEFASGMKAFADKGIGIGTIGGIAVEDLTGPKRPQEAPAKAGISTMMEDLTGGDSFAGFSQLGELKAQSISFEAQEKARQEEESRKAMADSAAATADAVKAGLEDTTLETTVNTTACVDGKEVSRSQAKHAQRLADRLGATTPPFVRRTSAEQGMIPSQ